ncbi:MAG: sulfate reduction electron transfer complex DsrMKJOP subunit DsrP [Syntrophales bacterium]
MEAWRFFRKTVHMVFVGTKVYYLWCAFLLIVIGVGVAFYLKQLDQGLIVTSMRDQVSWGLYIGNFTYLVGVAAAAVLLVIPAYIYHFDPIKEIVVLGELLAASAIITALLFVLADLGRPDRFWHMIPLIGILSFPDSLLAWDVVVLNGYLVLNTVVPITILVKTYFGKEPSRRLVIPLVLLSIPWAVGIHTVTAFLYNGLAARPFWNASILAPRFLASAFCSGPAMALLIFQILRKTAGMKIKNEALFKISELMAYSMFINLFLLGAELFKEYYSGTIHLAPMEYLYQGLHGHNSLVPWIWTATVMNITAFILFLIPKTRENLVTLNIGSLLIIAGVWVEKGLGLIVPGFIPDPLGEIYEYMPNSTEIAISLGIWACGLLIFTLFMRIAVPIQRGDFVHSKYGKPALPPQYERITP